MCNCAMITLSMHVCSFVLSLVTIQYCYVCHMTSSYTKCVVTGYHRVMEKVGLVCFHLYEQLPSLPVDILRPTEALSGCCGPKNPLHIRGTKATHSYSLIPSSRKRWLGNETNAIDLGQNSQRTKHYLEF